MRQHDHPLVVRTLGRLDQHGRLSLETRAALSGGRPEPAQLHTTLGQDSSPEWATASDWAGQSKIATTLAGAALARTIRSGKQATVKPVAGRAARL
jgi:hypothetical protein